MLKATLGLALGVILIFSVFASNADAEHGTKKTDVKKDKNSVYDISSLVNSTIHSKSKESPDKTDAKKVDIKKLTKSKGKPIRKIKQN